MSWGVLRVEGDQFGARTWDLNPTFEFSPEQVEHIKRTIQKIDEDKRRRPRPARAKAPPKDSKTIRRVNCLEF